MPLLERGYRAATSNEIERRLREIEIKDKIAQTKEFESIDLRANIDFAKQIELITPEQAESYIKRMEMAKKEFEKLERNETRNIVNDFENPLEISSRYYDMEEYNLQIARERELNQKTNKDEKADIKNDERSI